MFLSLSLSSPSRRKGQVQIRRRQREIVPEPAHKRFLGLARRQSHVVLAGEEGRYASDFHEAQVLSDTGETTYKGGEGGERNKISRGVLGLCQAKRMFYTSLCVCVYTREEEEEEKRVDIPSFVGFF